MSSRIEVINWGPGRALSFSSFRGPSCSSGGVLGGRFDSWVLLSVVRNFGSGLDVASRTRCSSLSSRCRLRCTHSLLPASGVASATGLDIGKGGRSSARIPDDLRAKPFGFFFWTASWFDPELDFRTQSCGPHPELDWSTLGATTAHVGREQVMEGLVCTRRCLSRSDGSLRLMYARVVLRSRANTDVARVAGGLKRKPRAKQRAFACCVAQGTGDSLRIPPRRLSPFLLTPCATRARPGRSGVITKSAIAPLERMKILFQVQTMFETGKGHYGNSMSGAARTIMAEEGIKGFYKGTYGPSGRSC